MRLREIKAFVGNRVEITTISGVYIGRMDLAQADYRNRGICRIAGVCRHKPGPRRSFTHKTFYVSTVERIREL